MALENQSRRSEQNPFPAALEEVHSQGRFEVAHLLRDVGLGN